MDSTSMDSDASKCDELSDGNPQIEHSIDRGASKVLQQQQQSILTQSTQSDAVNQEFSSTQRVGNETKQSELLRKFDCLTVDNISPDLSPTHILRDESKQTHTFRARLESFPRLQSFQHDLPHPEAPAEFPGALSQYNSLSDRLTKTPVRKWPKERQNAFMISNAVQKGIFKALEGWDGVLNSPSSVLDANVYTKKAVLDLFCKLDRSHTGTVEYEDFLIFARKAIKSRSQSSFSFLKYDSKLERAFCDVLASKLPAEVSGGNFAAAVRRLFHRFFDINHSGHINLDELEMSMANLNLKPFNFTVHGKKVYYMKKSCCFLSSKSRIRKCSVWLMEWWVYKTFVIVITLLNVIALVCLDFNDPHRHGHRVPPTDRNGIIERLDIFFLIVYLFDFILKGIGMGLIGYSFRTAKPAERLADLISKNTRQKRTRKTRTGCRRYLSCLCTFTRKSNLGMHERRALDASKSNLCCRRTADNAFFHDRYNILDFVLLLSAFAACMNYFYGIFAINVTEKKSQQWVVGFESAFFFRALIAFAVFRAVRPIRLLTSVPQTRAFVATISRSLFGRRGPVVMISMVFIDIIFATIGMALFLGQLRYRCHFDKFPSTPDIHSWPVETANGDPLGSFSGLCSPWANWTDEGDDLDRHLDSPGICDKNQFCRSAFRVNRSDAQQYGVFVPRWWNMPNVTENTTIEMMDTWVYRKDLNYGITHFDGIVASFMTIFQCSTLEGWIEVFYLLQDTAFNRYVRYAMMAYILLICVITNFVMWNLFFAVVEASLSRELIFNQNMYSTKLFRRRAASVKPVKPLVGLTGFVATTTFLMKMKRALKRVRSQSNAAIENGGQQDASENVNGPKSPKHFRIAPIRDDGTLESGHQPKSTKAVRHAQVMPIQDDGSHKKGEDGTSSKSTMDEDNAPLGKKLTQTTQTAENDADNESEYVPNQCSVYGKRTKKCCLHGSGWVCSPLVASPKFESFFLCVIVINIVVIMVATYFPRPRRNTNGECDLEAFWRWQSFFIADIVFICIYLVEMVLKMIGLGVVGYFWRSHKEAGKRWDGKNTLDAFVCIAIPAVLLFEARFVSPWDPCPTEEGESIRLGELIVILRVARLLRIIRHWKSLYRQVQIIIRSFKTIAWFLPVFVMYIIIAALLGCQFFGHKLTFDKETGKYVVRWEPTVYNITAQYQGLAEKLTKEEINRYFMHPPWTPERQYTVPRTNFDTVWSDAVPTVFQLLSGEDWNVVFYDCYRACGSNDLLCQAYTIVYFVIVMVMGNYILLNILLAIMLQNAQSDNEDEDEQSKEAAQENSSEDGDSNNVALSNTSASAQPEVAPPEKRGRRREITLGGTIKPKAPKIRKKLSKKNSSLSVFSIMLGKLVGSRKKLSARLSEKSRKRDQRLRLKMGAQQMKSLLISRRMSKDIVLRSNKHKMQFCLKYALMQPGYSYLYIAIASTLVFALLYFDSRDSVREGKTYFERMLIEIIFNAITCFLLFLLLLLRGLAFGLSCKYTKLEAETPSLQVAASNNDEPKSLWDIEGVMLDIFVLLMLLIALIMHGCNILGDSVAVHSALGVQYYQLLYYARIFDSCRSILLVNAFRFFSPTTNLLFLTIWKSVPRFFSVLIVWAFILLVFGIIFVDLYAGQFNYCDLSTLPPKWERFVEEEVGITSRHHAWLTEQRKHLNESAGDLFWYKENCTEYGGKWMSRDSNFDTLHNSLLTLFHMSTMEGWVTVMRYATDRVDVGIHPIENYDMRWGLGVNIVYIFMIILSSNLFVSSFLQSFDQSRGELEGTAFLTTAQRQYKSVEKMLLHVLVFEQPSKPKNCLRRKIFEISQSHMFNRAVLAIIIINTILIMSVYEGMKPELITALVIANHVFGLLQLVEIFIKIISLGPKMFFFRSVPRRSEAKNTSIHEALKVSRCESCRMQYCQPWLWKGLNMFDFTIVTVSTVGTVVDFTLMTGGQNLVYAADDLNPENFNMNLIITGVRVLRNMRVLRLLHLMYGIKPIQIMMETFMISSRTLLSALMVLIVSIVICSSFARALFSVVMVDKQDLVLERANFQTFFDSFATLVRSCTGEGWHLVMFALAKDQDNCVNYDNWWLEQPAINISNSSNVSTPLRNLALTGHGCGIWFTYPFFVVYILLTFFLLINLFIAVIVEAFGTADSMYSRMVRLEEADVDSPARFRLLARHGALISRLEYERFCTVWNKIDIRGLLFIDMKKVPQLMRNSRPPFSLYKEVSETSTEVERHMKNLRLPIYISNKIFLHDYILSTAKRLAKRLAVQLGESADDLEEDFLSMVGGTSHLLQTKFKTDCICKREQYPPAKHTDSNPDLFVSDTRFRVHNYDTRHYYAAKLVQRFIKRRLRRKKCIGHMAMSATVVLRTASEMVAGASRHKLGPRPTSDPGMSPKEQETPQSRLRVATRPDSRVLTSL